MRKRAPPFHLYVKMRRRHNYPKINNKFHDICLLLFITNSLLLLSSSSSSNNYISRIIPIVTVVEATSSLLIKESRPILKSSTTTKELSSIASKIISPLQQKFRLPFVIPRGGSDADADDDADADSDADDTGDEDRHSEINNDDDDEERYSRQLYTLGGRAQALVRGCTVIIDGPLQDTNNNKDGDDANGVSGLLCECVKNLALSGVGSIVLLVDDERNNDMNETNNMNNYHDPSGDDLGTSYIKGALNEHCEMSIISSDNNQSSLLNSKSKLLEWYIKRLNPGVKVSTLSRQLFLQDKSYLQNNNNNNNNGKMVFLCIDRPRKVQIQYNEICRRQSNDSTGDSGISFISAETAGVYGILFCDFGDHFRVIDENGKDTKNIPLDSCSLFSEEDGMMKVECVDGERHELSLNDRFQFISASASNVSSIDGEHDDDPYRYQWEVVDVLNPYRVVARPYLITNHDNNNNASQIVNQIITTIQSSTVGESIRRIKVPKAIPFLSLQRALQQYYSHKNNEDIFSICDLDKGYDLIRRNAIISCFHTLEDFVHQKGRLPMGHNNKDVNMFIKMVVSQENKCQEDTDDWTNIVQNFGKTAYGKFVPIQAFFGAIASQEVLKAVTGLYQPVKQFLLYDCDEVLNVVGEKEEVDEVKDGISSTSLKSSKQSSKLKSTSKSKYNSNSKPNSKSKSKSKTKLNTKSKSESKSKLNTKLTSLNNHLPLGMERVIGHHLSSTLCSLKLFVVGSGAIGCELLKNLAAMGAGTINHGCISLTDMDQIERSNLSRQLLFRDSDIGSFKSIAAEKAVKRINPNVRLKAYTSKVVGTNDNDNDDESKSGSVFDEKFWSKGVNVALNALDNVEARLTVDAACVSHRKHLVDSGTLGPSGNVQVVVPNYSESYGSSVDPPEPGVPVCTLKNFPYETDHVVQWGRDLFDGLFKGRPERVNENFSGLAAAGHNGNKNGAEDFARMLLTKLGEDEAIIVATELDEDVPEVAASSIDDFPSCPTVEDATAWAAALTKKLFHDTIRKLLRQHPRDSLDDDGKPFWSGTRRFPIPLSFSGLEQQGSVISSNDIEKVRGEQQNEIDRYLIDFVRHAARLRIETYATKVVDNKKGVSGSSLSSSTLLTSKPSIDDAKMALEAQYNDQKLSSLLSKKNEINMSREIDSDYDEKTSAISRLSAILYGSISRAATAVTFFSTQSYIRRQLNVVDFEKDDPSNGHVDFVSAASNLRSQCYSIPSVSTTETRRIAGHIVPAMITTTAVVSALSCIEAVKIAASFELSQSLLPRLLLKPTSSMLGVHRNSFVNLALPFFAFTPPLPAESWSGPGGQMYNLWDRVIIKESKTSTGKGGMTLRKFLRKIVAANMVRDKGNILTTIPKKIVVSSISFGSFLLYANFLHDGDKSILCKPLLDLVMEAVASDDSDDEDYDIKQEEDTNDTDDIKIQEKHEDKIQMLENQPYLDLSVVVEDTETGEDFELPSVRFVRWRSK